MYWSQRLDNNAFHHGIELAILNLALNARDAMPQGGQIHITVGKSKDCPEGKLKGNPCLLIRVADTGSGMDSETLKRAIDPFFSTKPVGKGTGLDLSMINGLADQLGGSLQLASELGRGTEATIWLPIATTQSTVITAECITEAAPSRSVTILFVDDDPLIAMSTVDMLEDLGHVVIAANSAKRALEILDEGHAIDLLLTDQAMPDMTGVELGEIALVKRSGLPVLLATGYSDLPTGTTNFPRLTKPYLQEELQSEIGRVLTSGASATGA